MVRYFSTSEEQPLQTETEAAFRATGLLLVPVSQREEMRKMLEERVMPLDHRTKGAGVKPITLSVIVYYTSGPLVTTSTIA